MAITSADINNQRFSIDRKGYDVDEVDVFLERVAYEIDELNAQLAQAQAEAQAAAETREVPGDGFAPVPSFEEDYAPLAAADTAQIDELNARIAELEDALQAANAAAALSAEGEAGVEAASAALIALQKDVDARDTRIAELENLLAEANEAVAQAEEAAAAQAQADPEEQDKDALIADLEERIETLKAEKEADSKAISQALLVAQRSADEIVGRAEEKAGKIVDTAKDEADDIRKKAQEEKQRILDAIADYREKRNEAQNAYKAALEEIVENASSTLNTLESDIELRMQSEREAARRDTQHAIQPAYASSPYAMDYARSYMPQQGTVGVQIQPAYTQPAVNYVNPAAEVIPVNPSPAPAAMEKDMSGYGDTGIYDFDELD